VPDPATPDPTPNRAHEVAVPPRARALSTLPRIDYANAILIDTGPLLDRTGEQWARAVLEEAPTEMRAALTTAWTQLGIQLGPARSDRHVLGWTMQRSTPRSVLLHAGSPTGLQVELLVEDGSGTLLFASFIQHDGDAARAAWAEVEDLHAPVMGRLIEEAVARDIAKSALGAAGRRAR
jgi:hypothetical protein